MDLQQYGNIAFKLAAYEIRRQGIVLPLDKCEIEKLANEIGISKGRLRRFMECIEGDPSMTKKGGAVSSKEQGEVALRVVKYVMRRDGINLSEGTRQQVENVAKGAGMPVSELIQFAKSLAQEFVDEYFALE